MLDLSNVRFIFVLLVFRTWLETTIKKKPKKFLTFIVHNDRNNVNADGKLFTGYKVDAFKI